MYSIENILGEANASANFFTAMLCVIVLKINKLIDMQYCTEHMDVKKEES
jgi:hypothetical protein